MLLQNGSDARHDRLFGGRGGVSVEQLVGPAPVPPFSAVLRCELDPGGSVGPHRQEHDPELLIGLEGEGQVTIGGHPFPFVPGTVAYLELGQRLEVKNLSADHPLCYLIVKARAT